MKTLFYLFTILVLLAGCTNDKPRPEGHIKANSLHTPNGQLEAITTMQQEKKASQMHIKHHVKGRNVYIECFIPNFSLSKRGKDHGYLQLYVDGKIKDKIHTAAFFIKDLSRGDHQITIEMVSNHSKQNKIKQTIHVTI
ncbi:hypothetical protein [Metabacillus arenae]|uniref:Lipoprotein n=1 Tax=Metabacillus arenae TaxID=2771434 RepID=A0A926NNB1_9BACI|nr:hypothetical protein [Metabacillus arenae]MBD1380961.1 hypothetical protein [Metabacillus arenae]